MSAQEPHVDGVQRLSIIDEDYLYYVNKVWADGDAARAISMLMPEDPSRPLLIQ